uniref:CUB domain-containing protein n=1 Tax=Hucho hucho TaxID=62062 RepID=A0A4W5MR73_9TELE
MSRNHSKLIFVRSLLLAYDLFTANCDLSWINNVRNDAYNPPDDRHGNAFFALRSCHQVMRGKSGEFFSPDYLCSNPPLWCNWTIQVDPGKRVHLHLEDFTQSDACSGKLDQIHLDEPLGVAGGHRILEKCWREAKYTSLSNILHVVQLIGGKPIAPHRGFYGRYEAFVPPVTYNAYGDTTEEDWKLMTEPKLKELEPFPSLGSFTKFLPMKGGEPTEAILLARPTPPAQTNPEGVFDYFDQLTSSVSNELPLWEAEERMVREGPFKFPPVQREEEEWNRGISEGSEADESHLTNEDRNVGNLSGHVVDHDSHLPLTPTPPMVVTRQGTSWSERGATQTHTAHLGSDPSTHQPPVLNPKPSPRTPSAMRRNVDAQSTNTIPPTESNIVSHTTEVGDQGEESGNKELLKMTMGESTSSSDTHPPIETQDPFNHLPNMVEPFFDSRPYEKDRNNTEVPHLPEDHLFEVAVEVNFLVVPEENWDHLVRSLLISVKSLVIVLLEGEFLSQCLEKTELGFCLFVLENLTITVIPITLCSHHYA